MLYEVITASSPNYQADDTAAVLAIQVRDQLGAPVDSLNSSNFDLGT